MSSFCFILSSSSFLNWTSDLDTPISQATRKLFHYLKRLSSIGEDTEVVVVKETDEFLRKAYSEDKSWAYNFIKKHYSIEENTDGNEINAITELAKKKSKVFDNVIIVNGTIPILYQDEELAKQSNIQILNELRAYSYVIRNCNC